MRIYFQTVVLRKLVKIKDQADNDYINIIEYYQERERMKKLLATILGGPILWGGILSFGYYWLIHRGIIANELLVRYTAGHPVEYITVIMFLIGMVGLLFRGIRLGKERKLMEVGQVFPPLSGKKEDIERIDSYLETLEKVRQVRGKSLLLDRLKAALLFLKFNGAPSDLEQELRYLSEEEGIQAESNYGMVKMFIWAIPILGFLGTVIGITQALGNLNLTELEATSKNLADGLQVAFDTTALALSLVFILYFTMFFIRNREGVLFQHVDFMAEKELRGRFADKEEIPESKFEMIDLVLEKMASSWDRLVERQTILLTEAMDSVNEKSDRIVLEAAQTIERSLGQSLAENVSREVGKLMDESVLPLIDALKENSEDLGSIKRQMLQEEKLLEAILRAGGEISRLEEVLNGNLAALRESGHFEEAVNTLSAAVSLLSNKSCSNAGGSGIRLVAENDQIDQEDISNQGVATDAVISESDGR